MRKRFLAAFLLCVTASLVGAEEDKTYDCNYVMNFVKDKKYEYVTPNEETIARRLYYPKIEQTVNNYIKHSGKDLNGMYYADVANNGKPLLLLDVKEKEFCNYSYFVYIDGDSIKKLFPNDGREYTSDFANNYKLFCKGGSRLSIITVNGINYIVNSNYGGRINRIDRIRFADGAMSAVNVCRF